MVTNWQYMKLLTAVAVYEITDSNGTAERMIIFVRCFYSVSLVLRKSLLATLSTLSQGSNFSSRSRGRIIW